MLQMDACREATAPEIVKAQTNPNTVAELRLRPSTSEKTSLCAVRREKRVRRGGKVSSNCHCVFGVRAIALCIRDDKAERRNCKWCTRPADNTNTFSSMLGHRSSCRHSGQLLLVKFGGDRTVTRSNATLVDTIRCHSACMCGSIRRPPTATTSWIAGKQQLEFETGARRKGGGRSIDDHRHDRHRRCWKVSSTALCCAAL